MSVEVIHRGQFTAHRQYDDDAWEFMSEWLDELEHHNWDTQAVDRSWDPLSEEQLVALKRYFEDPELGRRINPGDCYERQYNKYEGRTYTWRAKKIFFDLCSKYDLFPEL